MSVSWLPCLLFTPVIFSKTLPVDHMDVRKPFLKWVIFIFVCLPFPSPHPLTKKRLKSKKVGILG